MVSYACTEKRFASASMHSSLSHKRSNIQIDACAHTRTQHDYYGLTKDSSWLHWASPGNYNIFFPSHLPPPPPIPHPCRFSSWMVVRVCDWWVNEDHFAVWADGEHWSACWQVAYSLLSELALSNTQRDTRKNTHLCTNTAAALSPNWYPEGFDGERVRDGVGERVRDWYERGKEHQKRRPAGQLFTSKALKQRTPV